MTILRQRRRRKIEGALSCSLLLLALIQHVTSFSRCHILQPHRPTTCCQQQHGDDILEASSSSRSRSSPDQSRRRRQFLVGISSSFFISFVPLLPSQAVMMKETEQARTFKAGEAIGVDEARLRFQNAKKDLQYLIDNYDTIVANGGGDNVRRYLGTVGVTSNLYGISKVMKELQDEANDIVEYTEAMDEFDAELRAADTACYSANFVEFSAASTKPEKFFRDALAAIHRMMSAMEKMSAELDIK